MLAEVHPFIQSLEHIMGFLMVLITLATLWGLTVLLGKYFRNIDFKTASRPSGEFPSVSEGPTEEEAVVISAAVAMLMGRRARIVSFRSSGKDWGREGLREHFASHKIR